MSFDRIKAYFSQVGLGDRVMAFEASSATVEEAALAVGCEPARIAKTLSFITEDGPILIVAAGDVKIDNKKYKDTFRIKAKMIPGDQVEDMTGFSPGGVCPFGTLDKVRVHLDESLKRFDYVYPAAGNARSAVKLNLEELYEHAKPKSWVDVCKSAQ